MVMRYIGLTGGKVVGADHGCSAIWDVAGLDRLAPISNSYDYNDNADTTTNTTNTSTNKQPQRQQEQRKQLHSHVLASAHLHHALEWLRQKQPPKTVLAGVLFQLVYTSVFGAFAVFVQLRTGRLVKGLTFYAWHLIWNIAVCVSAYTALGHQETSEDLFPSGSGTGTMRAPASARVWRSTYSLAFFRGAGTDRLLQNCCQRGGGCACARALSASSVYF